MLVAVQIRARFLKSTHLPGLRAN